MRQMDLDFDNPNFAPLAEHIGERVAEWMWMYRERGLEFYKHIQTRHYLILDAEGDAWTYRKSDGSLIPAEFAKEYRRATAGAQLLPPAKDKRL